MKNSKKNSLQERLQSTIKIFLMFSIAIFMLNITSAVTVIDSHGTSLASTFGGGAGEIYGEIVYFKNGITQVSSYNISGVGTPPTNCYIKADNNTLYIGTFVSSYNCSFTGLPSRPTFSNDTTAYFFINSTTSFDVRYQGSFPHPVTGSNLNWITGKASGANFSVNGYEINSIYSEVYVSLSSISTSLISPTDGRLLNGTEVIMNVSLTPIIGNLTNVTFYIWNSTNGIFNKTTNIRTGSSINYSFLNVTNLSIGSVYSWNAFGCMNNATGTQCSWATSNRTFISSAFSGEILKFNLSTFETSREYFILNISANPSVSSVSSRFFYNGTQYSSLTTNGVSSIYQSVGYLDIPLAENYTENKTFYWEFTFGLTSGNIIKQNSTIYSQQVNKTYLAYCNSTLTTQFVNFTTREAKNPFPKVNASIKMALLFWVGGGNVKNYYSFENLSETLKNWTFCSNKNLTYNTEATIEYDANGYSQNFYYLTNATLTNVTNAINIYLLNDSEATVTELKVEDNSQNAIPNATIQIQLYDVGTDTYYTVGMAKTSFNGKDIVYLNWYSTLYKFIITKGGEVLKITDPYKISETPQTFVISDSLAFSFDKFRGFVYSLIYNNATQNFVLTFTKPSGLVDQGCLRVTKRTASNDTEICLTCETSSSATIYCNIGSSGNGTFIATFYATGSWYLLDWIDETIGVSFAEEIYDLLGNDDATAYAFLFSGVVVSMFFLSPILAIVGLILGILGGAALGFTILNYSEFIGIVLAGAVVAWLIKR